MSGLRAALGLSVGDFRLDVDLTLEEGVLVLFGPSGSGKTLTVLTLSGGMRPDSGRIELGGRVLFDSATRTWVPPRGRRVGYVPQHDALFPFRTVRENVAFGLPRSRRRAGDPGVDRLLEELEIRELAEARPGSLSGGERQRVALARALAVEPELLLLDEPFASIDRQGRSRLRGLLKDVLSRHPTPTVFVTHSVGEALELGDQVVRYERGRTAETGPPSDVLSDFLLRVDGQVTGAESGEAPEGRRVLEISAGRLEGPAQLLDRASGGNLQLEVPLDTED